ncbi:MAG TPA: GNAT family N-acetyltransferase [Steroidobacteraceae bacterium]|jgi:ribosomal protein S18 acetylase RimI-like enzyme|nr:GNAT family N-acetyltransferase [Steroidobacteraceae bacterium]
MPKSDVHIRRSRLTDAESLCDTINSVAREKWSLATADGFTPEQTRSFLKFVTDHSLSQVVAVANGLVVGWCDVVPKGPRGFAHVGALGMGVRREWRRQGVGRRLLDECLPLARSAGLEKIELEVFTDNEGAIHLYESLGFVREGVKVRARKLEGRYQDVLLMALWLVTPATAGSRP